MMQPLIPLIEQIGPQWKAYFIEDFIHFFYTVFYTFIDILLQTNFYIKILSF
ncbi:hypothetical protein SAMN05216243_2643 [Sediminibacillus albus]|uniref:Uncharacterized protein n=1 Tax=Sediminibacillus albus TaxID=407036 RepID=A0A1G9ANZ6_9BACI|nr:hypothetical protein SAMN05216243_2643 [Sediminibacillus albus]